jgi:hypothetical protein
VIVELERAEAEAYGSIRAATGRPFRRIAGAVCVATPGVEDIQVNRVTALGIEREPTDVELEEIEEFFGGHGARFAISVMPGPLHDRRLARGYAVGPSWMKFKRDASAPPASATELTIVETSDPESFGDIVAKAFGLPPDVRFFDGLAGTPGWTLFLARAGAEPAGAAALFVHERVGWLGITGTVPEHRGKGAQTALLAARLLRGRELGVRQFTVETGEKPPTGPGASYRNIVRAGFAEAYLRPNVLSPE